MRHPSAVFRCNFYSFATRWGLHKQYQGVAKLAIPHKSDKAKRRQTFDLGAGGTDCCFSVT